MNPVALRKQSNHDTVRHQNGQNKYYCTIQHHKTWRHLLSLIYYSQWADIVKNQTKHLVVWVVEFLTSFEFTVSLSFSCKSEGTHLEKGNPKMWDKDIWLY